MLRYSQSQSSQRGLALLMVLMVLAVASVIGLSLIERTQSALIRTQALTDRWAAMQLTTGMEIIAERAIKEMTDPAGDLAGAIEMGQWSPPYEIPGGVVQGRLIDLGGRFNLNALAHPEPQQRAEAQAVFTRLLQNIRLNARLSVQLMAWLGVLEPQGVSDARAIKAPLVHVTELREMPGMDESTYQALVPWVAVWPSPDLVLNINATQPEILAAFVAELDVAEARRVLADRTFRNLEAVWAQPLLNDRADPLTQPGRLGVTSPWFLAHARVVFDRASGDQAHHRFRLIQAPGSGYDFRYVSQGTP